MPAATPRPIRDSILLLCLALTGCTAAALAQDTAPPSLAPSGTPWTEADALFHQAPRWLGSDAAYSIPLDAHRTLWLFGDTFIAMTEALRRDQSVMVSNTLAIQHGLDPTTATLQFYWRESKPDAAGGAPRPQAFLPDTGEIRYWPVHGAASGKALLVFWMRVAPSTEGLGFSIEGTRATRFEMIGDDPRQWPVRDVALDVPAEIVIASMGVAIHDGWLHALSTRPPGHRAILARWSADAALRGDLEGTQWWTGTGWASDGEPLVLFEDGAPEGSLHFDRSRATWISVQSTGFGGTDLDLRTAPTPQGPWSSRRTFFRPPESDRPHTLVYAGKAHPELRVDGLAVTYAQNASDFATLVNDSTLYWPRFVLVNWR